MSMRNMVGMFGAMAVLRRIDQEEPLVLLYARVGYLIYVALTSLMYILLHFRIIARRDMTLITVPVTQKAPSFSETMEQARKAAEKAEAEKREELQNNDDTTSNSSTVTTTSAAPQETTGAEASSSDNSAKDGATQEDEQKMETITVMEYDLRHLSNARRSWATSSCFLAVVHYNMQSVSPLVMSAVMGTLRLMAEDPLIQIHLRGLPAVEKLARPFAAEKNPLASMFKDFGPKDGSANGTSTSTAQIANGQSPPNPDDDLHDDGDDDDDDDDAPTMAGDIRDDHIKSDFDDEDEDNDEQSKKNQ